ncbi:hypothetical protein FB446DRAFT_794264 [Lentinula raphanica]|nr:hypothetical protein FB446DRAFT_794264 [Lentinula raphanica]
MNPNPVHRRPDVLYELDTLPDENQDDLIIMRLFSTRLLPRTLFLSIVVSAFATPIIVRPRGNEGTSHTGDATGSNFALFHLSQLPQKSKPVDGNNREAMQLVLIREEPLGQGLFKGVKDLGSEVTPDEYLTMALLPVSYKSGDRSKLACGLRTIPQKAEGGRYTWKWDVRYRDRKGGEEKAGEGRRKVLPNVDMKYQYEVLGTVWLSPEGKRVMNRALNNVAPSMNLLYLNNELMAAVEARESLEKDRPNDISVLKLDFTNWNEFFARMVKVRGSGAGFAITEKDHPEEWKLYVQAEKELEKRKKKKEGDERKRKDSELDKNERKKTKLTNEVDGSKSREVQGEEDAQLHQAPSETGQTLRVDGSREAMEAALFGRM